MDNVCHSLAGAAIAQAGFAGRFPRATLLCVLGANIPDVDAFTYVWAKPLTALQFRRGWTHGVPALLIWTLLLAAAFWWWNRRSRTPSAELGDKRFQPVLTAAACAVFSHTSLDWLNNYGVRWLVPFSERWFYGDTLFIVDLVLLVLFGGGWWLSRRRRKSRSALPERPARIALALALVYVAFMKGISEATHAAAARQLNVSATGALDLMVAPSPFSVFKRDVLVRRDATYEWHAALVGAGSIDVSAPTSVMQIGAHDLHAQAASRTPEGKGFLRWSRFPYFVSGVDGDSTVVFLGDARYTIGTQESWAATRVTLR